MNFTLKATKQLFNCLPTKQFHPTRSSILLKTTTTSKRLNSTTFAPSTRLQVDYNTGGTSIWVFARDYMNKYNCINHGQGFPNWDTPEFVKESFINAIKSGNNQYTLPSGNPELVNTLIEIYSNKFNMTSLDASNIQTTIGACGAIENCMQAILNDGDEVITFEPYFDFYKTQVGHAGGILKTVPLSLENNNENGNKKHWKFDKNKLENAINEKTRILLLNTPHNPTGFVFTKTDLEDICNIVLKHPNLLVISDEVYENIIFNNHKHYHIATFKNGEMFNRTITVNSGAKKFSATGWKIGWCVGPSDIIKSIHFVTRGQTWCQSTPTQMAIAHALKQTEIEKYKMKYENYDSYYEWLKNMYYKKSKLCEKIIVEGGFIPIESNGSFFMTCDATNVINKLIAKGIINDQIVNENDPTTWIDWQLTKIIAKHANATCLPISAFVENTFENRFSFLRFSFCVTDDAFEKSLQGMKKFKQFVDTL